VFFNHSTTRREKYFLATFFANSVSLELSILTSEYSADKAATKATIGLYHIITLKSTNT
jgi:hypothetical protein